MPGYCVAGTVGHRILNGARKIELENKQMVIVFKFCCLLSQPTYSSFVADFYKHVSLSSSILGPHHHKQGLAFSSFSLLLLFIVLYMSCGLCHTTIEPGSTVWKLLEQTFLVSFPVMSYII